MLEVLASQKTFNSKPHFGQIGVWEGYLFEASSLFTKSFLKNHLSYFRYQMSKRLQRLERASTGAAKPALLACQLHSAMVIIWLMIKLKFRMLGIWAILSS
jgi:hypothetical protein